MTLMQVWGALLILLLCPLIGSLPTTGWIVRVLAGKKLSQLGTGNVSVSAAFYHGGRLAGILAVLTEALKGILAVLLARYFFGEPTWELIALILLVIGRYWGGRGAGTTNVVWGYVVHDWRIAGLTLLIGSVSFTLIRNQRQGKFGILVLPPLLTLLLHPTDEARFIAATALSLLIAGIYRKIPDDLDLSEANGRGESRQVFRFLRGDRAVLSLDQPLDPQKVGHKAATLSQLKRWGYPVPMGWVLPAGDDPAPLAEVAQPSGRHPVVVRSSAVGEDSETASAAGLYESLLNITSPAALEPAIARCFASYNDPAAVQYRQRQGVAEGVMAVLIQHQVDGAFSGVAFSRDPMTRQGNAVVIEALPGGASRVVSGRETPEQYRVWIREADLPPVDRATEESGWVLPDSVTLDMEGSGDVPPRLIQQVAFLARHLESRYHGIPQDVEWTYDGQHLWILQARPITTLLPIWTRKIAAEVIPGQIHPLTWSINRPLTCGVWGDLFTLVLGKGARGLDFNETATLHYGRAYFNASLLGQIFRRMGLPPESLEFLTRGAPFTKPAITSTLSNLPGLLRLLRREWRLPRDFRQDDRLYFTPGLAQLTEQSGADLDPPGLLARIEYILTLLRRATYYSILAPLSLATRQAVLKVEDTHLDNGQAPEVQALRSLRALAEECRPTFAYLSPTSPHSSSVFAAIAEHPDGQPILQKLDGFLSRYGYLSEVGTDIAVPTWQEDPRPVRELLTQFLLNPLPEAERAPRATSWKIRTVQHRLNLKGRVTEVYSRFLAELRWSVIALEQRWLQSEVLITTGDLFFLELDEVRQLVSEPSEQRIEEFRQRIASRRSRFANDQAQSAVPALVYGNEPPAITHAYPATASGPPRQMLQGIGASPGWAEGPVKVLRSLQAVSDITPDTILVVPYTDSGWAPLLAQVSGLIAEVGGRLSHGAIVAREYGIPAVMDISDATHRLQEGQHVRIDGQQGTVEIL